MRIPEPLPDFPTVAQLRDWMAQHASTMHSELSSQGAAASELTWPIQDSPKIRILRASWQNPRPFPSDDEIMLLMLLCTPRDKPESEIDRKGIRTVISLLMIMGTPNPTRTCIHVDIYRRLFMLFN